MNQKDFADALDAVEQPITKALYNFKIGWWATDKGDGWHALEALRNAAAALHTLRTLAEKATLTDADTERLVAHGEHLKDLEENR